TTEAFLCHDVRRGDHIDRGCVGPTSNTTIETEWERRRQREGTTANQVPIPSRDIVGRQHRHRPTPDFFLRGDVGLNTSKLYGIRLLSGRPPDTTRQSAA